MTKEAAVDTTVEDSGAARTRFIPFETTVEVRDNDGREVPPAGSGAWTPSTRAVARTGT